MLAGREGTGNATVRLDTVGVDRRATFQVDILATQPDWNAIARTAQRLGFTRISQVASLLSDPALMPDVAERLQAMTDLEAAFLDPTGELRRDLPLPPWRDLATGGMSEYVRVLGDDSRLAAPLAELRDRLASFDDLTKVDWPMDVPSMGEGSLGAAVNAYAPQFKKGTLQGPRVWLHEDPLVGASVLWFRALLVRRQRHHVEHGIGGQQASQ